MQPVMYAGHLAAWMGMRADRCVVDDLRRAVVQIGVFVLSDDIKRNGNDPHKRTVAAAVVLLLAAFQRRCLFVESEDCCLRGSTHVKDFVIGGI